MQRRYSRMEAEVRKTHAAALHKRLQQSDGGVNLAVEATHGNRVFVV